MHKEFMERRHDSLLVSRYEILLGRSLGKAKE